jgi:hypothetical protein
MATTLARLLHSLNHYSLQKIESSDSMVGRTLLYELGVKRPSPLSFSGFHPGREHVLFYSQHGYQQHHY